MYTQLYTDVMTYLVGNDVMNFFLLPDSEPRRDAKTTRLRHDDVINLFLFKTPSLIKLIAFKSTQNYCVVKFPRQF